MHVSRILSLLLISVLFVWSCKTDSDSAGSEKNDESSQERADYAIAIHGGAGTILKKNMTPEREEAIRAALGAALDVGEGILKDGGTSLEAVERTIHVLENSPYFNAGKGAVFTNQGTNEMDASIMQGSDKNAGSVGGCLLYTSPSPRDRTRSRMPSSA